MRLEDLSGPRHTADDRELSNADLTPRVARISAKGRREVVLPIGAKTARDIDIWNMVSEGLLAVGDAAIYQRCDRPGSPGASFRHVPCSGSYSFRSKRYMSSPRRMSE